MMGKGCQGMLQAHNNKVQRVSAVSPGAQTENGKSQYRKRVKHANFRRITRTQIINSGR